MRVTERSGARPFQVLWKIAIVDLADEVAGLGDVDAFKLGEDFTAAELLEKECIIRVGLVDLAKTRKGRGIPGGVVGENCQQTAQGHSL